MGQNHLLGGGALIRELAPLGLVSSGGIVFAAREAYPCFSRLVTGTLGASTALLLAAMLFPTLPDSVSAEEANTKVSLTVNPVIGIALDEAVTVEVLPTAEGTFSSNKANLSVTTNNETGYSLYLATTNGENTLTSN